MKRFLFIGILFVLCLTSFQAHAQRYLPGMKGLQVTAGMTDGVHWNANTDFAYHIGAAYSVYTKNANRWVIGGEYLHKKYDYKDMRIPVEQFTAEGGYYQPTTYQIRYFQPDGKGKLEMDNGTVFLPNDLYPLEKETFWLYYTSASTDQQTIDIYIIDSFGQMQQLTLSFNNDNSEEGTETITP